MGARTLPSVVRPRSGAARTQHAPSGPPVGAPNRTDLMRRPLLTCLALALVGTACASGGGAPRSFENPLGLPQNISIEQRREAPVHRTEVSHAAQELASEVTGVYRYLGLEVEESPRDPYLFFTPSMRITGQLYEGERNSAYLNCGSALQGERADVYEVEFALVTRLRPLEAGGTVVETRMEGRARDRFVNEVPVYCTGTGKLEAEIAELLRRGGVGDRGG